MILKNVSRDEIRVFSHQCLKLNEGDVILAFQLLFCLLLLAQTLNDDCAWCDMLYGRHKFKPRFWSIRMIPYAHTVSEKVEGLGLLAKIGLPFSVLSLWEQHKGLFFQWTSYGGWSPIPLRGGLALCPFESQSGKK